LHLRALLPPLWPFVKYYPVPAPAPAYVDEDRPDVFAAIDAIFQSHQERIDELERRIAALEAKPAARSVEHIRDATGAIIRSVLVEDPAA